MRARFALPLLATLFFMWGLITSLNDILVPHLRGVFSLNYAQAALIQFTFFIAYFIASLPAGALIGRVGYRSGIVIGLLVGAVGTLLFVPASMFLSYALFLAALFVLATGMTILQVAANPYVTLIGEEDSASSRLNLTQAFNSLGTTVGPAVVGRFILAHAPDQSPAERVRSVQGSYLGITVILLLIAGVIALSGLPQMKPERSKESNSSLSGFRDAWRVPHLRLGVLAIFLYVGAEVTIGTFLIDFMRDSNMRGFSPDRAAFYVALYWGGAMVGRFLGAAAMKRIPARVLLGALAMGAIILVSVGSLGTGSVAVFSILAVGLMNSIMFPTIFALGVRHLGEKTSGGSGLLVMGVVGGAVFPMLAGLLADRVGVRHALLAVAVSYAYIAFYGFVGSSRDEGTEGVVVSV